MNSLAFFMILRNTIITPMRPKLIDIHAHVQFSAFKTDADEVIQRALDDGIFMISPSSQMSTSKRAIDYAKKYPGKIWAGVGLHPIHLKPAYYDPSEEGEEPFQTRAEIFDAASYEALAQQDEVKAIGETGLDYAERLTVNDKEQAEQERVFRGHIAIALKVQKPLIQHTRNGTVGGKSRDAHEDALRIIAEYSAQGLRGTAHCYSGTLAQAKRYLDLGFYLSFTGLITFNHSWAEVIKYAPLKRIMVETDIPYMTPEPYRGKRNEPSYVRYVAEHVAALKELSFEEVAEQTTKNAIELFKLPI